MTDELISGSDLTMWLSVSRATLDNLCRDGNLSRFQPQDVQRCLPHYKRADIDAYLKSVYNAGHPAIAYRPIDGEDPLMTVHEAARALGIRSMDITSWREARAVPSYRIRHSLRFRLGDLTRWVNACAGEFGSRYLPNRPARQLSAVPSRLATAR